MNFCKNNILIIENPADFNIKEILECGQYFRFYKIDEGKYKIIAHNRVLTIEQNENQVQFYPCNEQDVEMWSEYFDLNTDYSYIKNKLCRADEIMQTAVDYAGGIRILNQEPYECLLSFIISQNNNIPRIKGIIERMSENYGNNLGEYFSFPSLEQLSNVTEQQLYDLRMGFRAKYIFDAVSKIKNNEINLEKIQSLPVDEARSQLMKIKGVGQKVADCTLLFSLKKHRVFPVDVWVKRVMEYFYFNEKETDIKDIHNFAEEKWGEYAGYAQQYLFYYARSLKIGQKK